MQSLRLDGRRIPFLEYSIDQHGLAGLRTTRIQYRQPPSALKTSCRSINVGIHVFDMDDDGLYMWDRCVDEA